MKSKNLHPRSLYPAKLSFRIEGQIKSSTDKEKLKEFITTKPGLREMLKNILFFFFKYILLIFVQRGRERDRELEASMRESHRSAASCTPPTGDVPATKVHALDRNRTRDLSVPKPTLYPLSQTGFGAAWFFKEWIKYVKMAAQAEDACIT